MSRMTPSEIQARATAAIDRVRRGLPHEDQCVEMKGDWIDPVKAARRFAALCNAARHEDVLIVVGVKPDGTFSKCPPAELANWWAQVEACFDQQAPPMQNVLVPWADGNVAVALWLDSTFAPYVITSTGCSHEREIPWREGNRTRTARRHEVLLTLARATQPPDVKILSASVDLLVEDDGRRLIRIDGQIYVVPKASSQIVFPVHLASALISTTSGDIECGFAHVGPGTTPSRHGPLQIGNIQGTRTECIVGGPGNIHFTAVGKLASGSTPLPLGSLKITLGVEPTGARVSVRTTLEAQGDRKWVATCRTEKVAT